jgi:hypothetical protein
MIITMKVELQAGVSPVEAFTAACELAGKLGVCITFDYNGSLGMAYGDGTGYLYPVKSHGISGRFSGDKMVWHNKPLAGVEAGE